MDFEKQRKMIEQPAQFASELKQRLESTWKGMSQADVLAETGGAASVLELAVANHQKGEPLLAGAKLFRGAKDPEADRGSFADTFKHSTPMFGLAKGYASNINAHIGFQSEATAGLGVIAMYDMPEDARFFRNFDLEAAMLNGETDVPFLTIKEAEKALQPMVERYLALPEDQRREEGEKIDAWIMDNLYEVGITAEQKPVSEWIVDTANDKYFPKEESHEIGAVVIDMILARKVALDRFESGTALNFSASLFQGFEMRQPGVASKIAPLLKRANEIGAQSRWQDLPTFERVEDALNWRKEQHASLGLTQLTNQERSSVDIPTSGSAAPWQVVVQTVSSLVQRASYGATAEAVMIGKIDAVADVIDRAKQEIQEAKEVGCKPFPLLRHEELVGLVDCNSTISRAMGEIDECQCDDPAYWDGLGQKISSCRQEQMAVIVAGKLATETLLGFSEQSLQQDALKYQEKVVAAQGQEALALLLAERAVLEQQDRDNTLGVIRGAINSLSEIAEGEQCCRGLTAQIEAASEQITQEKRRVARAQGVLSKAVKLDQEKMEGGLFSRLKYQLFERSTALAGIENTRTNVSLVLRLAQERIQGCQSTISEGEKKLEQSQAGIRDSEASRDNALMKMMVLANAGKLADADGIGRNGVEMLRKGKMPPVESLKNLFDQVALPKSLASEGEPEKLKPSVPSEAKAMGYGV